MHLVVGVVVGRGWEGAAEGTSLEEEGGWNGRVGLGGGGHDWGHISLNNSQEDLHQ